MVAALQSVQHSAEAVVHCGSYVVSSVLLLLNRRSIPVLGPAAVLPQTIAYCYHLRMVCSLFDMGKHQVPAIMEFSVAWTGTHNGGGCACNSGMARNVQNVLCRLLSACCWLLDLQALCIQCKLKPVYDFNSNSNRSVTSIIMTMPGYSMAAAWQCSANTTAIAKKPQTLS